MPSDRKPSLILTVAAIAFVVLLAGYVGAYYWLVTPLYESATRIEAFYSPHATVNPRARVFFAPMNWLDRHIRPHMWDPAGKVWSP